MHFFNTVKKKEYKEGGWHRKAHFLLHLEVGRNMRWRKETTKQKKIEKKRCPMP
jgi:hypothetical protein